MIMIIGIILGFFIGGTVMFFAIAACAVSKQADERIEKLVPLSEGARRYGLHLPLRTKFKPATPV